MPLELVPTVSRLIRYQWPTVERQKITPIPSWLVLDGAIPDGEGNLILPDGVVVGPGEFVLKNKDGLHQSKDGNLDDIRVG